MLSECVTRSHCETQNSPVFRWAEIRSISHSLSLLTDKARKDRKTQHGDLKLEDIGDVSFRGEPVRLHRYSFRKDYLFRRQQYCLPMHPLKELEAYEKSQAGLDRKNC